MVERRGIAPERVLRVLTENYGRPVDATKISEVVWGSTCKVSDHYIYVLMKRCRAYIENEIDPRNSALYGLFSSTSYMLSDSFSVGSWVSLPYEHDRRMNVLSSEDDDMIHQYEVKERYRLVGRLSREERELFGILCDLTEKNDGGYVSRRRIATEYFGIGDFYERQCIRNNISRLRVKIDCLNSVSIQTGRDKGYRVVKKS